jgi:hypothetical protein
MLRAHHPLYFRGARVSSMALMALMALMAIPPRHGRATQVVNNSLKCVVRGMLSRVFDVASPCRGGDCTYTA